MDVTPEHRHSLVVAMICCFKDSLVTGGVVSCWKGVGSCEFLEECEEGEYLGEGLIK